jgi:ribonuclease HI
MNTDQPPEDLEWKRMRFKKNKVWLAMGPDGKPVEKNSKVLIKYQLEQDYEYWVKPASVKEIEVAAATPETPASSGDAEAGPGQKKRPAAAGQIAEANAADVLSIYTDGASCGNPGPAGIGALMHYRGHIKELSESIGIATNNVAELKAVEVALAAVNRFDLPVRIFTDSSYVYGVLSLNWKAQKNQAQIALLKKTMARFADLRIVKVKGHAGLEGNERADQLAVAAIKKASI